MLIADYAVVDPETHEPEFVAKVVERIEEGYIEDLKKHLLCSNIRVALVVSPAASRLLVDKLTEDDANSFTEVPLDTPLLLGGKRGDCAKVADPLALQREFQKWLELLVERWDDAVPLDYTEYFVPDVIGSVAHGHILVEYALAEY